jgi:hypothetical protein
LVWLAFRLRAHAILANLMLPDCLGQTLPLLLVFMPRVQCLHAYGLVEWRRGRVIQLNLAVVVADHNVVVCRVALKLGLELVMMQVLVLPLRVGIQVKRVGRCG